MTEHLDQAEKLLAAIRDSLCWLTGHVLWQRTGEYSYACICMNWRATDLTFRFEAWKRRICFPLRHPLTRRWWIQLPPWDNEHQRWANGAWRSACWCGETGAVESKRGLFLIE